MCRLPLLAFFLWLLAPGFLGAAPPAARSTAPTPQAVEFFEKHVRPLLVNKCVSCHGPDKHRGGLRLDSAAALRKGGDSGAVVVPGKPDKSLLIKAVRHEGELKMPKKGKLDARSINVLVAWVRAGAPWPAERDPTKSAGSSVARARSRHWSFRPVKKPGLPAVKLRTWARTPIDVFVLARLEAKGLTPAPQADRRTLIRRLSFDLLGLPPTPREVAAFEADRRPDAYERLVDRLLASPHYGERWGRHWLDVARYADTRGYVFTQERRFPYSYTYRDYVVRAFNEDLPYHTFILQQLAADRLELGKDRRPLAAMGFLTLGRRFLNNIHDILDDRIDVTMRGLQGLTVACARCHDHKFDPIPTRDYYSLYGVFASSVEPAELPLITAPAQTAELLKFQKELKAREDKLLAFARKKHAELLPRFRARVADYLLAAQGIDRKRDDKDNLSFLLVGRWRRYLAATRKAHHPIFAPWHAFAALPARDFAARAPALAARFAAKGERGKSINPAVARAFAGKAPADLADVARRYGELLAGVERRWRALKAKTPAAVRLPEADQEALRQVLYGRGGPTDIPVAEIGRYANRAVRDKLTDLRKHVDLWKATASGAPPRAMVLVDAPHPHNPRVLVRGNPGNLGVPVPRQYLEVLSGEGRKPFTKGSGRLELARAIASKDNPLTARVMVNRIWQHHFGRGLVSTPSDFGLRGEPPTHPDLLDWLAATFVEQGWSVKALHRLILRSAVYRQASDDRPLPASVDPENSLLWRMNRRRLEFEPLRDALLAAAGRLDRQMGGRAVDITRAPFSTRRSIYGFIDRQNLPGLFRTFDLASPDSSTAQRHTTTVPQQALFLMNGPFAQEQARHFAARAEVAGAKGGAERVRRMHWLAYGRPADAEEVALGLAFVKSASADKAKLTAWEQYAQVLLLANEFAFVD
jgi:hypothetical protein